eukprot:TRINITY_DN3000_c0_g1_i1.p1 TRINITY_DN3000_c0_g1~~TRINITY_DN3000_c0_g1_i1.p1  ORF type:complete len:376 (+),score=118.17 TRINITY_DN3000_c0_g1_i1:2-1129(+)
MPRRLSHCPSSQTFCVLTISTNDNEEASYIRLFDDQTFEMLSHFKLDQHEFASSVTTCTIDENYYYVVGTSLALPHEHEPSNGRLLVFRVRDQQLMLITEMVTKGTVSCICEFEDKILIGVKSEVILIELINETTGNFGDNFSLKEITSYRGHILIISLAVRGDFIIVGDLMRSMRLLKFNSLEKTIEEIARDFEPNWMNAVEVIDDDTFIGSENFNNIFTTKKNTDAISDEERGKLQVVGQYHLGEFVNRFRHGSLVMKLPENENKHVNTLLYGTVNGSIGIIASISEKQFKFFHELQNKINKVIQGVGGFRHSNWREFRNNRDQRASKNFIDGDLIETFLELKNDKMEEIAKSLNTTVSDLCKVIEDLSLSIH